MLEAQGMDAAAQRKVHELLEQIGEQRHSWKFCMCVAWLPPSMGVRATSLQFDA